MIQFYTNRLCPKILLFLWLLLPLAGFSRVLNGPDDPTHPDSTQAELGPLGHLECIVYSDTNCTDKTLVLEAWIHYTFTDVSLPVTVPWSTGQVAHKIIVTPPGYWYWDATGIGCELVHQLQYITINQSFFNGPIDIMGPPAICPFEEVELTVNTNGYTEFSDFDWNPDFDDLTPITISTPGTYTLTVSDAFGCPFTDSYNIPQIPPFMPQIIGPPRICPEVDTATLIVNGSYTSYEWSNGSTGNSTMTSDPGIYQVTATDSYGCTGVGTFGLQTAGIDPFSISQSSPSICPGQTDTLRVVGGFSHYNWSNGVNQLTNIVDSAGTYIVTVTNVYGCTATSSVTVNAIAPPNIQLVSTPLCPGGSATISVTGGMFPQYLWSNSQNSSSISINSAGTYSVTVSGNGICSTSTSLAVVYAAVPTTVIADPGILDCAIIQDTLDGSGSSSGPNYSFTWATLGGNFPNGSDTLNPVVDAPGTYILSITDLATGCTASDTTLVLQNIAPPGANAGPPASLTCANLSLNIGPIPAPTDSTLLPSWATGNGHIGSGADTWSPNIDLPGTYLLTVTSSTNHCTSTASVTIGQDITAPTAQIAPPDLLTCTQSTVMLSGAGSSSGPNFTYLWTASNNGTLNGPVNGINANAVSAGTYTLQVTNTLNGCTSTASTMVDADINIPVVSALPPNTLTCAVNSVTIDASGSSSGPTYQYNWTTTNGNIQSGDTTLTPVVTLPGLYTLSLINTANSCTATLGVMVQQDIAPPAAVAGPNATLNCTLSSLQLDGSGSATGPQYSYAWSASNGGVIQTGGNTLTPTVSAPGTYVLTVTNSVNGCTSSASTQVLNDNNAPDAIIALPNTLTCMDSTIVVDAGQSTLGPGYSLVWTGPGIIGDTTSQTITVNTPGTYQLTIVNSANGCVDTASVNVPQDIAIPPVDAGNDLLIDCNNPSGMLGNANNPGGATYTLAWTTTGGNIVGPADGPTITADLAGVYQLQITNTVNGCSNTDQVQVNSDFAAPAADAGQTAELTCVMTSVVLQGSGSTGPGFTYQWTSADGHIVTGGNTLTPTVDQDGTYDLLVTNTVNGCASTGQVIITKSADIPTAIAGQPQTLTCAVTTLVLNGAGSSTGPEFSYAWSTNGPGVITDDDSLAPTINAPGVYTLTVTNTTNNCTEVASVTIPQDIQNPAVDAGADNTLTCAITTLPLQAQIVSSSSNNISYVWGATNGGQILNGGSTASPTISATGTYDVTVTDAVNGCTGTDQLIINNDTTPPNALIGNPATLTCTLVQTTLSTTGSSTGAGFTYDWTTQGGHFADLQNPQMPVVDDPGVYNLLITNTSNGCTQTATITVPENVQLPLADAGQTIGLDCDTQTNSLDGTGSSSGAGITYTWSTTNGQIVSGATTPSPVVGDPGLYVLVVTDNNNGCTQTDNVQVTEDVSPPVFSIANPALLTCSTLSVPLNASGTGFGAGPTFTWQAGSGGNIVNGGNTLHATVDAPGNYTLTVLNQDNGCTSTAAVAVTQDITPPAIQVQPALLLTCTVLQFPLQSSASAQTSVLWTTANGHIVSGANTLNPVVDQPGVYSVVATSTVNGCTSTNQIPVQQETNLPTGVAFHLDQPLCNGTPGFLQVQQVNGGVGPFNYSIDGGQHFFAVEEFDDLAPGAYNLVVQDANGCEIEQPVNVIAPLYPQVTTPPQFSIHLGDDQELQAIIPAPFPISQIEQVIWTPADDLTFEGTSIAQLLHPTAKPFRTTEYKVTVVTPEGCIAEARVIIKVDREVDVYAPNVIWPEDPDGDNGTFQLFARDESVASIQKLQIFDRWGTLIFENRNFTPNDLSQGWNGYYRGEVVDPAVFVWYAELTLIDGRQLLLKGDVTVVR